MFAGITSFLPWLQKKHPALIKNQALFKDFNKSDLLSGHSFVVFDTELTGLNKHNDEIISIGAVRIENLRISINKTFFSLIQSSVKKSNPSQATFVHRLTPEQLQQAPQVEDVLIEFIEFCGDSILVGHFVGIDMHFLNRTTRKILGGSIANPSIDTMRLACDYKNAGQRDQLEDHGMSDSYNLDNLRKEFCLPAFKAHDALEDALQTAYLFLFLLKKSKQGGIKILRELHPAGRITGFMG